LIGRLLPPTTEEKNQTELATMKGMRGGGEGRPDFGRQWQCWIEQLKT